MGKKMEAAIREIISSRANPLTDEVKEEISDAIGASLMRRGMHKIKDTEVSPLLAFAHSPDADRGKLSFTFGRDSSFNSASEARMQFTLDAEDQSGKHGTFFVIKGDYGQPVFKADNLGDLIDGLNAVVKDKDLLIDKSRFVTSLEKQ